VGVNFTLQSCDVIYGQHLKLLYAFFLGNSPASEFYMPTFRTTLFRLHRRVGTYPPMKMEHTECSETSAYNIQAPGNHPEESIQHSEHSESLESKKSLNLSVVTIQFVKTLRVEVTCSVTFTFTRYFLTIRSKHNSSKCNQTFFIYVLPVRFGVICASTCLCICLVFSAAFGEAFDEIVVESTLTVRGKSGSSRQSRNKALTLSSTTTSTSTTSTTDSSTTDEPTRSKRENSELHGLRYEACMIS